MMHKRFLPSKNVFFYSLCQEIICHKQTGSVTLILCIWLAMTGGSKFMAPRIMDFLWDRVKIPCTKRWSSRLGVEPGANHQLSLSENGCKTRGLAVRN